MSKIAAENLGSAHSAGLMSRLAYARAKQAGADVGRLLKKSGLTLNEIDDASVRLSAQKQIEFVELIADKIKDPNLGFHLARKFDLRTIGLLYYVAASAKTLGDALVKAARCSTIVNDGILLGVRHDTSLQVSFKYRDVPRYTDQQQIEFWITSLVRLVRHLTNREIHPLRIRVVHHKNSATDDVRKFLGVQIEGDANVDRIDFAGATWNLPVVNADPYLHQLLLRVCEDTLAQRRMRGNPFRIRIENAIVELLPHGHATVENVAHKLRTSPRKLARRLSAEGLTFSRVLRDLRATLAHRYLADKELSVSHIAWLLGYKEAAAFTNAFRRWSGKSPRAARAEMTIR